MCLLKNLFCTVLLVVSTAVSSFEDPFAELESATGSLGAGSKKQQQDAMQAEFLQYKKKVMNEYEAYEKQILAEYAQYKKEVAKVWGDDKAKLSDKKTWVDYSAKKTERSLVDFEKGEVTVELALTPEEAKDPVLVEKKLQQAVTGIITKPADTKSISDLNSAKVQAKSSVKKVMKKAATLADQIKTDTGKVVTKANVIAFAKSLLEKKKPVIEKTTGTDGKERVVVKTSFKLVPNHLKKRAEKFREKVAKEAARQKLDVTLVFSIMQTESHFNPKARSAVPAFGLMQLVPSSGAKDAYLYLHKEKKVVTDGYLYDEENNIEMGSAYLHILYYRYLRKVKDKDARLWCAISAYNTGVGNVYVAFVGKYQRSVFGSRKKWRNQALAKINSMNSEEVYRYLEKNLPYEETRHYVQRVRKRMNNYVAWR
jgi:membrane-bound lytic murein transglycosylase C